MIPRHLTDALKAASRQYPVITVTGPRQSGKTTLLRHAFPDYEYVSLEAPDTRTFAREDPRGFLARFRGPAILDEVQQVPDLFSYVQVLVDEQDKPGHFILSGSQNFLLLQKISQTLAGRTHISHLLPLSLNELARRSMLRPDKVGVERPDPPIQGQWTDYAFAGFYPRIHDRGLDPRDWLAQYFQTYLQRDIRDLVQIGDLDAFGRFVRLCAGRAGQLLNLSSLGNDCGISHDTARRWLSMLEASFVVFRLQPHHANFNKRLTKSPKLYFVDTGLLCFLLQIESAAQLEAHAMRGAVFENLVITELHKSHYNLGQLPQLYFWRDHRGNEIDLVMDIGGRSIPVEIKSGATIAEDWFKGLDYWQRLAGTDSNGILVYGGDQSFIRHGYQVCSWRQWT